MKRYQWVLFSFILLALLNILYLKNLETRYTTQHTALLATNTRLTSQLDNQNKLLTEKTEQLTSQAAQLTTQQETIQTLTATCSENTLSPTQYIADSRLEPALFEALFTFFSALETSDIDLYQRVTEPSSHLDTIYTKLQGQSWLLSKVTLPRTPPPTGGFFITVFFHPTAETKTPPTATLAVYKEPTKGWLIYDYD